MTDEQIVKGLEICGNNKNCCKCPYCRSPSEIVIDCNDRLKQTPKCVFAYDGETLEYCVEGPCPAEKTIETIRAEAVREFAERLKEKAISTFYEERKYVDTEDIDNLVKEMTEKEGGKG